MAGQVPQLPRHAPHSSDGQGVPPRHLIPQDKGEEEGGQDSRGEPKARRNRRRDQDSSQAVRRG